MSRCTRAHGDSKILDKIVYHGYVHPNVRISIPFLRACRAVCRSWRDVADIYLVRQVSLDACTSCLRSYKFVLDPVLHHHPALRDNVRNVEIFDWTLNPL